MTVASDLREQHGPRRRLFLRIAGHEKPLWEPTQETAPGGSDLQCLRAPEEEWSQGLNLATMEVAPSSMMFELDDIEDPADVGKSYFGKLFAPGRFRQGARTRLDHYVGTWNVDADATSIPATSTDGFPASGTAWIGQECFSYTSVTGGTEIASFDGCTRGLYPAIDISNPWGFTYRRPAELAADGWRMISQYPYTWVGRMVALYVVTWDVTTGAWHPVGDAELLWVGRISGSIRYNPTRASWQLGCESIAKDLDQGVATVLPEGNLNSINLMGTKGREFYVIEKGNVPYQLGGTGPHYDYQTWARKATIEVPADFYTHDALIDAIVDELNDATNWTTHDSGHPGKLWFDTGIDADGVRQIRVGNHSNNGDRELVIIPALWGGEVPCHALGALGWDMTGVPRYFEVPYTASPYDDNKVVLTPENKPFIAYHPLHNSYNGGYLALGYAEGSGPIWDDQGDWGSGHPYACVMLDTGVRPNGSSEGDDKAVYIANYSSQGFVGQTWCLSLLTDRRLFSPSPMGFVGQRVGDPIVKVHQRYVPVTPRWDDSDVGPFELLLPSLLSTGTPGYNGAYDLLPIGVGIGVPAALVDTQSFIDADAALGAPEISQRLQYVIEPGTPWSTLLHRECQLFGFFLAWDRGKLRLKSGREEAFSTWTVTLSESARANEREWVSPEISTDTVINTWHYSVDYDHAERKYRRKVTLQDAESREGLAVTKALSLEHPGIFFEEGAEADALLELIQTQVLSKQETLRFPWQVVDVTLAPPYARQVAIGDVVLYESARHPDPFGTGSMTTSCFALVIDFAQSFRRWTGRAKLLVVGTRPANYPWAPSAVVDKSATNGGWNNTTKELTLLPHTYGVVATDSEDGAAFQVDDVVMIAELSITAGGFVWDTLTVVSYNPSTNILTLAPGTTLADWPGGGTDAPEFVVVPAFYTDATDSQHSRGTWQADESTRLYGDDDPAQVWG